MTAIENVTTFTNTLFGRKKYYIFCPWKAGFYFVFLFILPLVTCPIMGQAVQKRQLKESDYSQWGLFLIEKVSSDMKWVSYRMQYDELDTDTLFVRNVKTLQTFAFPKAIRPQFIGNGHFICSGRNDTNIILDLKTSKQNVFENVSKIEYSSLIQKIILLQKTEQTLKFIDTNQNVLRKFEGVTTFELSPNKKEMLFVTTQNKLQSVGLINLADKSDVKWIVRNISYLIGKISWHQSGAAFTFFGYSDVDAEDSKLYFYTIKSQKLSELDPKSQVNFPVDSFLDKEGSYELKIADNLQKVFFSLQPNRKYKATEKELPEIWNGDDKFIYPREQVSGRFDETSQLAVWIPATNHITRITSADFPKAFLTGDDNYAIVSNPKAYEPYFDRDSPRDYYIVNVKTGERELFLQKQHSYVLNILPSPTGKYIGYYRDRNWWIYDINKKTHINITKNIKVPFYGKVYLLGAENSYNAAGWSTNDKEFILYDQYDLWSVKPDGTSFQRLTHGREMQIVFRIGILNPPELYKRVYNGSKSTTIDLEQTVVLKAEGADIRSGYFKWNKKEGEKVIVYEDRFITKIYSAVRADTYIYQEEKFDFPPRLVIKEKSKQPFTIYQSNSQHSKFHWSSSELIEYHNSKGKKLKGILYYPFNYDKNRKYPMVVHIYEKESKRLHWYYNPSLLTPDGYNPTVLCSKGYFVFNPDIEHENGNIGGSAVDCTVSAVREIVARKLVDQNKIGLIGHSFGGYQTNFIITQTDIFKAAVSGASITDLPTHYLTIEGDTGEPNMVNYQSERWRMEKSLFESPELYYKNSPISNAINIQTPLLLWSGKEDNHVDWHQSTLFYMALRRLGKKNILLLYPKEPHSLLKQKNQIDLTVKTVEWLDYYLKSKPAPMWINNSIR